MLGSPRLQIGRIRGKHGWRPTEPVDTSVESCNQCGENVQFCALAMTRSRAKREKMEDEKDKREEVAEPEAGKKQEETPRSRQEVRLQAWLAKMSHMLETGPGAKLLDQHYQPRSNLTLSKEEYLHIISHYFFFDRVLRFFCYAISVDIAKNHPTLVSWDVRKEAFISMLRTSQKIFPKGITSLSDSEVHDVKCMSLRLQSITAREIFDTKWLPVISLEDPLRFKLTRKGH
jgi:hypothetical protein